MCLPLSTLDKNRIMLHDSARERETSVNIYMYLERDS